MSISIPELTLLTQRSFRTQESVSYQERQLLHPLIRTQSPDGFNTYGSVQASRDMEALSNEYFAQEVFAALGFPVPYSILLRKNKDFFICSRTVAANVYRNNNLDSNSIFNPNFRITEHILTQFLAEAVIQDGDGVASAAEGDNCLIEQDFEIVRITYDRERASPKLLIEANLKDTLDTLKKAHAIPGINSSLEQERAMIMRLKKLQEDGSLSQIFSNTQVQATEPGFKSHAQKLETAWNNNINTLYKYYFDSEANTLKEFVEREMIRRQLADKIMKGLSIPTDDLHFKDTLIEKLRSPLYHPEFQLFSDTLAKELLENATLINQLISSERKQITNLELSRALDAKIIPLLTDIAPEEHSKYGQALYQKKRDFLLTLFDLEKKQKEEMLSSFEQTLDNYKNFLKEGGIEGLDAFAIKIRKIRLLLDDVIKNQIESILKQAYDPTQIHISQSNIKRMHEHVKYQMSMMLCNQYFSHLNPNISEDLEKMTKISQFFPIDSVLDEKNNLKPTIQFPQNVIDNDFNIQDAAALQTSLQTFFSSPTYYEQLQKLFYDPSRPQVIYSYFDSKIPAVDETVTQKFNFLKTQIQALIKNLKNALETDLDSVFSLERSYVVCQNFLEDSEKRFGLMIKTVGLSDKQYQDGLHEILNTECEDLRKIWGNRLPDIKKSRIQLFANDRFWTEHFLPRLFPKSSTLVPTYASDFSYSTQTIPEAKSWLAQQEPYLEKSERIDHLKKYPEIFFSRATETYLIHVYPTNHLNTFDDTVAKKCVEYYKTLFESFQTIGEPMPKVICVEPKEADADLKQKIFTQEGYVLRIEFLSTQQRKILITKLAEDCYIPSLDIEIKPGSTVAKHQMQFPGNANPKPSIG